MQRFSFVVLFLIHSVYSLAQCTFDIEIISLNNPFCPTSFDGQLMANAVGGSSDFSYEWKDGFGDDPPGGPQTDAVTLPFLMPNQTYWVFITDNQTNCTDSLSYSFGVACDADTAVISIESPFDINPVGYNTWSICEVRIDNLGCELHFKPEFRVSHIDPISQGDFEVEYYNTQSTWVSIPYVVNSDGDAVGYWGDENGETVSCNSYQSRPVRVRFSQNTPTASLGNYIAYLSVWSSNINGDLLSVISDTIPVNIVLDNSLCETLDLTTQLTDASCASEEDGEIVLTANGGLPPYQYSVGNTQSSTNNSYVVLGGLHSVSVLDANECEIIDSVWIGPESLLSDTLWVTNLYPTSTVLNWNPNGAVDGYHFRFKSIESTGAYIYDGIGGYNNNESSLDSNILFEGLLPSTTYEVQYRVNSLTDCVEGWSNSFYFTTPDYFFDYDVVLTCANENTGAIEIDFLGDGMYDFSWSGPNGFLSSASSISNLIGGDYFLTISDDLGNNIVDTSITVGVYEISNLNIVLNGEEEGITEWMGNYYATICQETDQFSATAGFSNYVWNGVVSGSSLTPWQTQIYFVEAIDSNACAVVSDTINTTVVSDFIDFYNQNDSEDYIQLSYNYCSLNPPIEIDVSSFISGSFSVQWVEQVIGESSTIIGDAATIALSPEDDADYTFNIGSCAYDFHINVYPSPELNELSIQDISCFGLSDGFVQVEVSSEVLSTPFVYSYFDTTGTVLFNEQTSATTSILEGIPAGDYLVTVMDAELCSGEVSLTVEEPDTLFINILSIQDVSCFGEGTGSVTASVGVDTLGGVAPYTFSLNGNAYQTNDNGTVSYSNLFAGNYTIMVTDANGCSDSISFQIAEPSNLSLSNLSSEPSVSCFGISDAYVQLLIEGGTAPYSLYKDGQLFVENELDSVFTYYNLAEGTYTFYAQDTLGCATDEEIITVFEPDPLQFGILNQENVGESLFSCSGDSTAFVQLTVFNGGTPPFDYQLEYPNGFWTPFTSTDTYMNLYAGTYIARVKDSSGCEQSITVQITEPNPIEYTTNVMSHVLCYGQDNGVYTYNIEGGVPPYQDSNGNNISASGIQTALEAGLYNIQLFDASQCEINEQIVITQPDSLVLFIDSVIDVVCYESNQGSIYAHVTGGTPPYQYFLNGVLVYNTPSTYVIFSELYASDYTVEVIDVYGCSVVQSNVQVDFLGNSPLMLSEIEHQNASCYQSSDGMITVEATGGCGNYTYWLDYDILGTGAAMNQFVNLEEDEYVLTVIDDCGCSDTLVTQITAANYLVLDTALVKDESCFNACDGEIHLTATGGFGGDYQFSLDQQNYQSSSIFQNLCAGTYQVSVLNNNCDTFITVEVGNPAPMQFNSIVVEDVSCFEACDGVLEANVVGGTAPYQYSINGGVFQNGNVFSALCPDVYAVLVEDANGCSVDSISLDTELHRPDTLIIKVLSTQHISCYGVNNGAVVVSVDDNSGNYGGTAPYTFTINGGDTQASMDPDSSDIVFDNLVPGEHFIELIDANGCSDTLTIFISEPEVLDIHVQTQMDTISCYGGMTGFVELNAIGGTPTYTYTIEGENTNFSQQSEWFYNLEADEYLVTVADVNGCQATINVFIEEYSEIQIEENLLQHQDVTCYGIADGSFTVNVTGGVGPYMIGLAGDIMVEYPYIFNDLLANQYIVEVMDSLQCTQTASVIINEPDPLQFSTFNINDVSCFGESNGNIIVELNGGTPDYQFLLNGDSVEAYVDLSNGNYHLEVLDANSCSIDSIVSINQPGSLLATVGAVTDVSCYGYSNGIIEVQASGGTINYQYQVNNNDLQFSNIFNGLPAGLHNILVLDNNGCEYQFSWQIYEPEELVIADYMLSDYQGYCVLCEGDQTGWVTVNAIGGTPNYQYYLDGMLNAPATNPLIQGLEGGNSYVLSVQDDNGCWSDEVELLCHSSDPIVISQNSENFVSPSCCYSNDGQIEVQTTGGATPLLFSLNNGVFQNINIFNNLAGGNYCVTVEDANACQKELCSIFLQTPECLELDTNNYVTPTLPAVMDSDSCWYYGVGQIYVEASGGSGFYEIAFNDNNDYETIVEGAYFNQLSAGDYWIYLRDSLNCQDSMMVIIEDNDPIQLASFLIDTIHCKDPCVNEVTGISDLGGFSVLAYGGTLYPTSPSLSYSVDELDSAFYQYSGTFQNLDEGVYSVNIKDDQDCVLEIDLDVPGVSAYLTYESFDVTCFGYDNGMAQVLTLDGGYNPWAEMDGEGSSNSFFNLTPGWHQIAAVYNYPQINPTQECICAQDIFIEEPNEIVVDYQISHPSCYESCDGAIEVTAWGGFEPYQYIWLNIGDTTTALDSLCAGYYGLKVQDATSCEVIESITLTEPNPIYPLITQSGDSLIVLEPTIESPSVGTPPYSYQWIQLETNIEGAIQSYLLPSADGWYTVLVTDSNNCEGYSDEYLFERTIVIEGEKIVYIAYPNPVQNQLFIKSDQVGEMHWKLKDVYGKVLFQGKDSVQWSIDMQHCASGTYILQIEGGNGWLSHKILKQ